MPAIEFEGKTTEEAIEKACHQLHLSKEELKFEILSTGSSGLFGLVGGKNARIRIMVEEKLTPRSAELAAGRSAEPARTEKPARRPAAPAETRHREPRRGPKPAPGTPGPPPPPTVPGPGESFYEGPEDEVMTQAREALTGILERMPVEGARVEARRIQDRVILNISGESSGLLIGKKGATLDAFQFLLNKSINRTRTDKHRIIVDVEDYRRRRHQSLIDLARKMAAKAHRSKRPVTISALSAQDRRVVHLTLQDEPGIKTRSRGEGQYKNVVLVPEREAAGQSAPGNPPEAPGDNSAE